MTIRWRLCWSVLMIGILLLVSCARPRAATAPVSSSEASTDAAKVIYTSPSALPTDDPEYLGGASSIDWDRPMGGLQVATSEAAARGDVAFDLVEPPVDLGSPYLFVESNPSEEAQSQRAVAWIFHEQDTTIDIVEQLATESESQLENAIVCQPDEVTCVSAGRGLTTLKDGSTAVWIHYPFGTSVEWLTPAGLDIVVMGPFDTLSLDSALAVANSMAISTSKQTT
jgi:hypothetical protein